METQYEFQTEVFTFRLFYCTKNYFHRLKPLCLLRKIVRFFYFVCEAIGTAATPGLLCQPRVIVKMIVEKQMECRLAG
jgi:hypothetical protein